MTLIASKHFISSNINRVVERRCLMTRTRGTKAPRELNLIERAIEGLRARRQTLHQLNVVLKGQNRRGVFVRAKYRTKKLSGGKLFLRKRVLLASGQVHQDCDVDRKRRFALESKNLLGPAVFENGDFVLTNIADDSIVSIYRSEQHVDQISSKPHGFIAGRNIIVFV